MSNLKIFQTIFLKVQLEFIKKECARSGEIFSGTGNLSVKRKFRSDENIKRHAQSLKLKNSAQWIKHTHSKAFPNDIPKSPYHYKEFVSWNDFLGSNFRNFRSYNRNFKSYNRNFKSYNEAKKYAQSLKIKSQNDWFKHTKSKIFPNDIKKNPYAYKEFRSMGEFLGTGSIRYAI